MILSMSSTYQGTVVSYFVAFNAGVMLILSAIECLNTVQLVFSNLSRRKIKTSSTNSTQFIIRRVLLICRSLLAK